MSDFMYRAPGAGVVSPFAYRALGARATVVEEAAR